MKWYLVVQIVLVLFVQGLRFYNRGEWNFVCGAHSIEENDSIVVTLNNPQTSLWTLEPLYTEVVPKITVCSVVYLHPAVNFPHVFFLFFEQKLNSIHQGNIV